MEDFILLYFSGSDRELNIFEVILLKIDQINIKNIKASEEVGLTSDFGIITNIKKYVATNAVTQISQPTNEDNSLNITFFINPY